MRFLCTLTNGITHTFVWNSRSTRMEYILHTLICGILQSINSLYITYLRTNCSSSKKASLVPFFVFVRFLIIFSMTSCFIRRFHDRNHDATVPLIFFILTLLEDSFHYIKVKWHQIFGDFSRKHPPQKENKPESPPPKQPQNSPQRPLGFAPPNERASSLETLVAVVHLVSFTYIQIQCMLKGTIGLNKYGPDP